MKALITIILAALVFTSCSTTPERDQFVPRRVKVPDTGVMIVRTIDTLYNAGDTIMVGIEVGTPQAHLERVVVQ